MNNVSGQIPDRRPANPSKLQEAWHAVKARATEVLSHQKPWGIATATALLVGTVTAIIGFGGSIGAWIITGIVSIPLVIACFLSPPAAAEFVALLMEGLHWLFMAMQPSFAVLTVVLAGAAVVGIAGLLGAAVIWTRRWDRLPPEAQTFYDQVRQDPTLLQIWDMKRFVENGVKTKEAVDFFRREFGHLVHTFDTDFDENLAKQLDPETKELFTRFDGKSFPRVKHIKAHNFNLKQISNLSKCPDCTEIDIGVTTIGQHKYLELLEGKMSSGKSTADGTKEP